jgi:hypothetical protein
MKFIVLFLIAILANADIFIRLDNVPRFQTNITQLCDMVLEVESPDVNRVSLCSQPSNYDLYLVWYRIVGMKIRNVTGRGFQIAPDEINANLTRAGFFVDPEGSVVVVLNYWKEDAFVIGMIFAVVSFFTILSFWVAVSTSYKNNV